MKFYPIYNYLAFINSNNSGYTRIFRGYNFNKPSESSDVSLCPIKNADVSDTGASVHGKVVNLPFPFQISNTDSFNIVKYCDLSRKDKYSPKKVPEEVESSPSSYSQPLLDTLSRVFTKEGFYSLNRYQIDLFNELCLGKDVLIHAETSSGKTFAILLYMVMKYFYQIPLEHLKAANIDLLLKRIKNTGIMNTKYQRIIPKKTNKRIFILCPTKELAVQCAQQIVSFADGNSEVVHLIIDEHDLCPLIDKKVIFVVGSSNQVESYLLFKDKKHIKDLLQSVGCIIFDEIDRLFKVPDQYAPLKKKRLFRKYPGSAYNILKTLLLASPKTLQVIGASASISRPYIRYLNHFIQPYRNNSTYSIAVVRKRKQEESTRYVSIPPTIQQFYSVSDSDTLESKTSCLASIHSLGKSGKSIVFMSSYHSLFSLNSYLQQHNIDCKILHQELGIKDNTPKVLTPEYKREASVNTTEMYNNVRDVIYGQQGDGSCVLIASTDSTRGLHIPLLDTVYILGKPRTFNEYMHAAGRVGRCCRRGRCIIIDSPGNIKDILSWQKQGFTSILPLREEDSSKLG